MGGGKHGSNLDLDSDLDLNSGSGDYVKGALSGIVAAIIALYALNISGIIAVSSASGFSFVSCLQWCYGNLGLSIIPFCLAD